tara:strand:- start:34 stop:318 length:285 start_codon:yes stop_codon:yes gene_type:complete
MKDEYAYNRKMQKFNQQFAKMSPRGDIMFRSMGGGVTYDVKPMSRHAYEAKRIAACTVRSYAPAGGKARVIPMGFDSKLSARAQKIAARAASRS